MNKTVITAALAALIATPVMAGDLSVGVDIAKGKYSTIGADVDLDGVGVNVDYTADYYELGMRTSAISGEETIDSSKLDMDIKATSLTAGGRYEIIDNVTMRHGLMYTKATSISKVDSVEVGRLTDVNTQLYHGVEYAVTDKLDVSYEKLVESRVDTYGVDYDIGSFTVGFAHQKTAESNGTSMKSNSLSLAYNF